MTVSTIPILIVRSARNGKHCIRWNEPGCCPYLRQNEVTSGGMVLRLGEKRFGCPSCDLGFNITPTIQGMRRAIECHEASQAYGEHLDPHGRFGRVVPKARAPAVAGALAKQGIAFTFKYNDNRRTYIHVAPEHADALRAALR